MRQITSAHFTELLRASAGGDETTDLEGTYLDVEFAELGYDSVAVLEIVGRLEREYDLELPDDIVWQTPTPRSLLSAVNGALGAGSRA